MKNSTYINVEFIVYEFISIEHGTQIFIARIKYGTQIVIASEAFYDPSSNLNSLCGIFVSVDIKRNAYVWGPSVDMHVEKL